MKRHEGLSAYGALAIGVVCIGWSAIFVKFAGIPGPASAFYRMLISGLVLIPWRLSRKGAWPSKSGLILILAGGACYALDLALWNSSILLTSAAMATLLANNAPLWVGLGTLLVFREKLARNYWLGLSISLSGMVILMGFDAVRHLRFNAGELLAIAASVAYAGYMLTTQRARVHTDTLTFMAISALAAILVLWFFNLAMGTPLTGYSGKTWAALAGMGLVSQLGGWLAINYALGHLKAAPVSVSLLGQAVVTTLLAMPLLGEFPTTHQLVGGLFVLAGIYVVNQKRTPVETIPELARCAPEGGVDGD
jgi:drug/metabolite transporter (DMT)-like permease